MYEIAKDEEASMAARHVALMLLTTGKDGARNFMELFEKLHGKPYTQLPEVGDGLPPVLKVEDETNDPKLI